MQLPAWRCPCTLLQQGVLALALNSGHEAVVRPATHKGRHIHVLRRMDTWPPIMWRIQPPTEFWVRLQGLDWTQQLYTLYRGEEEAEQQQQQWRSKVCAPGETDACVWWAGPHKGATPRGGGGACPFGSRPACTTPPSTHAIVPSCHRCRVRRVPPARSLARGGGREERHVAAHACLHARARTHTHARPAAVGHLNTGVSAAVRALRGRAELGFAQLEHVLAPPPAPAGGCGPPPCHAGLHAHCSCAGGLS